MTFFKLLSYRPSLYSILPNERFYHIVPQQNVAVNNLHNYRHMQQATVTRSLKLHLQPRTTMH